jgi:hypothetical protein
MTKQQSCFLNDHHLHIITLIMPTAIASVLHHLQHIGPDSSRPRDSFTLLSILNTGALWQFAGAAATSPACFLAAALVPRGRDAAVSSRVMLQQPEGGSLLHAGGTKPAGFWSGAVSQTGRQTEGFNQQPSTSLGFG